jgi:hypothetical protein
MTDQQKKLIEDAKKSMQNTITNSVQAWSELSEFHPADIHTSYVVQYGACSTLAELRHKLNWVIDGINKAASPLV